MAVSAQINALTRIDNEGPGLRIVLSSRPDEYAQAIVTGHLHNTAVIEIQAVDPASASQRERPPVTGVRVVEPDVLVVGLIVGGHAELLDARFAES